MDNHQFIFFQGSTPTLELVLPLMLDQEDVAVVTIRQGDHDMLEYAMNATPTQSIQGTGTLALKEDDHSVLLLAMTQADTLKLFTGDAEIQLRIVTEDGADTFVPVVGAVGPAFRKGELNL